MLLDVMMRGADGLTVLPQNPAGAATADLPVVFFTASVQDRQVASLRELDVRGVLAKPFDPLTLPRQLSDLAGWNDPDTPDV